jgi:hypothetical protein
LFQEAAAAARTNERLSQLRAGLPNNRPQQDELAA